MAALEEMAPGLMHTPAHFALLMDLARQGHVDPVIARTYPLHQAAVAQDDLVRRRHVGKIVMHPQVPTPPP